MTTLEQAGGSAVEQALEENAGGTVPAHLRGRRPAPQDDTTRIPVHQYTSQAFHDLEVERLWKRTWQWACREEDLRNVGDYVLYTIADLEFIVVRSSPDTITAFPNSCLHRGSGLRAAWAGNVIEFRCPFHGWCYDLEGTVTDVPCAWDFPDVTVGEARLPRAQVGTWDGWVFLNPDPVAGPLEDFLGVLPEHFTRWPFANRLKMAHVEKVVPCNWKVAQGQFMESYHAPVVHPQLAKPYGNYESKYDWFPPNVVRMLGSGLILNEFTDPGATEQERADVFLETWGMPSIPLPEGLSARAGIASIMRMVLGSQAGADYGDVSDSELIDGLAYYLFPNFSIWGGFAMGLVYRWRPYGNDPNMSLMDLMVLTPPGSGGNFSGGESTGESAPLRRLGVDETLQECAPEMGSFGWQLDQDFLNSGLIQRGLRSAAHTDLTTARYQEGNLRVFRRRLEDFLTDGEETPWA